MQGGQDAPVLALPRPDDDELGPRVLAVLFAVFLAAMCALALMGPEPALDDQPVTPATAAPAVPFEER